MVRAVSAELMRPGQRTADGPAGTDDEDEVRERVEVEGASVVVVVVDAGPSVVVDEGSSDVVVVLGAVVVVASSLHAPD